MPVNNVTKITGARAWVNNINDRGFMSIKDVTLAIGVSSSTIDRWITEGKFPKPDVQLNVALSGGMAGRSNARQWKKPTVVR